MDFIGYFESSASVILDSNDFEDAMNYFGYFYGAYHFVNQFDLFSSIEEKKAIEDIYNQLKLFLEDLAAYNMRVTID
ncbi:hypothetical protein VXN68_15395 [Acinetobacter schindleri]|uniref:hypothetical protein n=1 Tax=Acinetobacter schindleri TaxID=108981 RepID=UPI003A8BCC5D